MFASSEPEGQRGARGWQRFAVAGVATVALFAALATPVSADAPGEDWIGPYWEDDGDELFTEVSIVNVGPSVGNAAIAFRTEGGVLMVKRSKALAPGEAWNVATESGGGEQGTASGQGYLEISGITPVRVSGRIQGSEGGGIVELSFHNLSVDASVSSFPPALVPAAGPVALAAGAVSMFGLYLLMRGRAQRVEARRYGGWRA